MMTEEENEVEYTNEFIFCILIPSALSLVVSTLIVFNFLFVSTHFQTFIYHQISAFFALCDIITSVATLLAVPHLLNTDHCMMRMNMFLCGSFMKVMAVTFNTCLIYFVIATSSVPTIKAIGASVSVCLLISALFMFCIVYFNGAAILCFEPVVGSFHPDDVSESELRAFAWAYYFPVSVSFLIVITLLVMTYLRLQNAFNSALLYLVHRLIPYPLIFCGAYIPLFLFQLINFLSDGKRVLFLRCFGLIGMNISGAAFGMFYLYVFIKNVSKSNDDGSLLTGGSSSSRRCDLSWTTGSKTLTNSTATTSERDVSISVTKRDRSNSAFGVGSISRISEGNSDGDDGSNL